MTRMLPNRARRWLRIATDAMTWFIAVAPTAATAAATMAFAVGSTACDPSDPPHVEAPAAAGHINHDAVDHAVYVWQGRWTRAVTTAMQDANEEVSRWYLLAAELAPVPASPREPRIDWPAVHALGKPITLVVRVNGATIAALAPHLPAIVAIARHGAANGVDALQIDFDAGVAQLPAYAQALADLRALLTQEGIALRLSITALPAWLDAPAFAAVLDHTEEFVLQVHSLRRPTADAQPADMFELAAARRWIASAARLATARGVPWRVALPTYGYQIGLRDTDGAWLGAVAEGAPRPWPRGTEVREIAADPVVLAALVRELARRPPANMMGTVWFRLPIATDTRNWSMTTWRSVMRGVAPQAELAISVTCQEPRAPAEGGLVRVHLENRGARDVIAQPAIVVTLPALSAPPTAIADGIGRFALVPFDGGLAPRAAVAGRQMSFAATQPQRFAAGSTQAIGWIRLGLTPAAATCADAESISWSVHL